MYREEYPRPELVRESNWQNLNGEWEFRLDPSKSGLIRGIANEEFDKVINVPFCPESKLSGVEYTDYIPACCYRKKINVEKNGNRVLLHFEACYYHTTVLINGVKAGEHKGGYTPFSFDITDLVEDGENTVVVYVLADPTDGRQPSGKQSIAFEPRGCYYTRSTGIWQTVWLEYVPKTYLKKVKIDTDIVDKTVNAQLTIVGKGAKTVTLNAYFDGKPVGSKVVKTKGETVFAQIKLSSLKLWSIENPQLYDLEITVESDKGVDLVNTYFGMRSIEMDTNGMRINGKYVYQRLVLDQGYYREGIYTAPKAEDLMTDIEISQRLGFNGTRLHEKVFERRFLYNADRMGYIVWGEYPNWGFNHTADWATDEYLEQWMESVERDYNHPCVVGWCPTNETWEHQFHAEQNDAFLASLYNETKRFDPIRPVIDSSGSKHVKTDIFDYHDYDQNVESFGKKYLDFGDGWGKGYKTRGYQNDNELQLPYFMSEYGGIGWALDGKGWGYGQGPQSEEEFQKRYCGLTSVLLKNPKICALCYTQLYDVEKEQNGIYTYDRVPKFSEEMMDAFKKAMVAKAAMEKLK